ncbi:MAG TPA: slipin family protein [Bryobacterales bacterium]|nr:slipin family protein [Bryobacterales bacterium]
MELSLGYIFVFIVVLYVMNCIKILPEYERGVVFRLGRLLPQPKGPGLVLIFAPIDRIIRISLRVETLDVPPQDVITRDNVTVKVSAVLFFRVIDPSKAVVEVAHYVHATSQLAQTRLRSVLGEADLDELLSQREKLNAQIQETLDEHTGPWGIKVQAVEVKNVDLPEQMIRAIARQAEAERERRAKVIHAEGELQAAQKLTEAGQTLATHPTSITLRYLQTLTEIGTEKNTTVVFPLPIDLFRGLAKWVGPIEEERKGGDSPVPAYRQST